MEMITNQEQDDVLRGTIIAVALIFIFCGFVKAKKKFDIGDLDEGLTLVQNVEIYETGVYRLADDNDQPIDGAEVIMRINDHLSRRFMTNKEGEYFPQMLPEGNIVKIEIKFKGKKFTTEFERPSESAGIKTILPIIIKKNTQALNAPAFN